MSQEKAKRLKPTNDTARELFLKSGNLCAFPNCHRLMMDVDGKFVGQVCHIEAAEEGGERFNPTMTNEDRRMASNLMLMCYEHHITTNNENTYTVDVLKTMKADHERRFAHPDRAILDNIVDWTSYSQSSTIENLRCMNRVLEWNSSDQELEESCRFLNEYVSNLKRVPVQARQFLGAVVDRFYKMRETRAVHD